MLRVLHARPAFASARPCRCLLGPISQFAVSANDGKAALVDGANMVPANPPADKVTIIDFGVRRRRSWAKSGADQRGRPAGQRRRLPGRNFAIVTAAMKLDPADPKKTAPDNRFR